jgi:hypothetical protein
MQAPAKTAHGTTTLKSSTITATGTMKTALMKNEDSTIVTGTTWAAQLGKKEMMTLKTGSTACMSKLRTIMK